MPKKEPKALAVVDAATPSAPNTPLPIISGSADSLISQAIAVGASIDTIERLMVLRKDIRAENAKEEFNRAMAAFQAACPVIEKTKEVKTNAGKVAYKYAPIESIVDQVKDLLQEHGFRYSTTIEFEGELVKAVCRVVHELGHEEVSVMPVPLGAATAIMSQSQRVAAASTFAKRYAFLNAFGIMTGDEDNDARKTEDDTPRAPTLADRVAAEKLQKEAAQNRAAPSAPPVAVPKAPVVPEDTIIPGKIRTDQMKKLHAAWGEYAQLAGIGAKDSKPKRQELMKQMFAIDSSTNLTERQADELYDRIVSMSETARAFGPAEEKARAAGEGF